MKVLAIDTTTGFLCLGLLGKGRIYEFRLETGRLLSSVIAPLIERAVEGAQWKIKDIDYLAVGLGPGSFTGMRIGIATMKGLGWALNRPVIGVPTLDVIARNALAYKQSIAVAVDAKRGLVYCSLYDNRAASGIKRVSPYMLISSEVLLRKIKPNSVVLGDALQIYKQDILKACKNVKLLDSDCWYPQPLHLVDCAVEHIKSGAKFNAAGLKPIYLYPKECQIRKP